MNKNPWHDINSSMTALKLGVGLLREEIKSRFDGDAEIEEIVSQLDIKVEQSISQIAALRKRYTEQ